MGAEPSVVGGGDSLIFSELGSDPDLADLVALFVDELPQRLALMEQYFETADWDSLRRTAHQLKGAAGSYGFHTLSPQLLHLERQAAAGQDTDTIRNALDSVTASCGRVRAGTPSSGTPSSATPNSA